MKKNNYYILVIDEGITKRNLVSGYIIDESTMIYSPDYRKWLVIDVPTGIRLLGNCFETRSEGVKQYYDYFETAKKVRAAENYQKHIARFNNSPLLYPEF